MVSLHRLFWIAKDGFQHDFRELELPPTGATPWPRLVRLKQAYPLQKGVKVKGDDGIGCGQENHVR
jgi:hypothetical protein